MPLYEYRCPAGERTERSYAMHQAPNSIACPECGQPAGKVLGAPRLSVAGTSAYRLMNRAERSAHEPEVVSSTRPGSSRRRTAYSADPRHRRLPRP